MSEKDTRFCPYNGDVDAIRKAKQDENSELERVAKKAVFINGKELFKDEYFDQPTEKELQQFRKDQVKLLWRLRPKRKK